MAEDLSLLSGADVLTLAGLRAGEVDVLLGCPPCQVFSKLSETSKLHPTLDEHSKHIARRFSWLTLSPEKE